MTSSPADQFQSAAKKTINKAIESQKQLTADISAQAGSYLGSAPATLGEGYEQLGNITGADPAAYVSGTRAVYPQLQGQTDAMRGALADFKPGIIDSGSTRKTTDYLQSLIRQYERGLTGQAIAGSERLRQLPGMAREAFETSYKSPAFELMKDAQAMNMAEDPKTVSQLTDPRFQKGFREYMEYGPSDFYNYNV